MATYNLNNSEINMVVEGLNQLIMFKNSYLIQLQIAQDINVDKDDNKIINILIKKEKTEIEKEIQEVNILKNRIEQEKD